MDKQGDDIDYHNIIGPPNPYLSCKKFAITDNVTLLLVPRIKLDYLFGSQSCFDRQMISSTLKSLFQSLFQNTFIFPVPFVLPEDDIQIRYLLPRDRPVCTGTYTPLMEGSLFFRFPYTKPKYNIIKVRNNLLEKVHGHVFTFCDIKYELKAFVPSSEDVDDASDLLSGVSDESPPALIIKGFPSHWFVEHPEQLETCEPSEPLLRIFFESFGDVRTLNYTLDEITVQYTSSDGCREALKSLCSCSLQKEGTNEKFDYTMMLKKESNRASKRRVEWDDPLLIPSSKKLKFEQNVAAFPNFANTNESCDIEPITGLGEILKELLKEKGIIEVRISREGFVRYGGSQDLHLWLSNGPLIDNRCTLQACVGIRVQEIQVMTTLDREGIKEALQRVFERVL